jgi:hypothetical protein
MLGASLALRGFSGSALSRLADDPAHWRRRAEDIRAIANGMTGLTRAKEAMHRIAEEYELKAQQAEGRLQGRTAGT